MIKARNSHGQETGRTGRGRGAAASAGCSADVRRLGYDVRVAVGPCIGRCTCDHARFRVAAPRGWGGALGESGKMAWSYAHVVSWSRGGGARCASGGVPRVARATCCARSGPITGTASGAAAAPVPPAPVLVPVAALLLLALPALPPLPLLLVGVPAAARSAPAAVDDTGSAAAHAAQ